MRHEIRPALAIMAVMTLLTGLIYPLAVTGLAQALYPVRAHGSLVTRSGHVVGSALIGQAFAAPRYFQSRPSAAGTGYAADNSGGSNLGPTNRTLIAEVRVRAARLSEAHGGAAVPVDLVTASASGLDPDISPAAALFQVPAVAKARGEPDRSLCYRQGWSRATFKRHREGSRLDRRGIWRCYTQIL